jgi:hypothetical protein
MQELKFVRTEDGSLVVTDDLGELYKVVVDDAVVSGIRSVARGAHKSKASPRDIQALIRTGKSAEEVAALTGADLEDVERFEVPVIDERNFVLENAQRVLVMTNPDDSHSYASTFGDAMQARLEGLDARDVEWFALKDELEGWLVGADFRSHEVTHHAVWKFDHKKHVLSPLNEDAKTLSKQGDVGDRLIPKLRAVENEPNHERFDSGAFRPAPTSSMEVVTEVVQPLERETADDHPSAYAGEGDSSPRPSSVEELAVTREEEPVDFGQTADLLEALRKRRGERDSQPQPTLSAHDLSPNSQTTPVEHSSAPPALADPHTPPQTPDSHDTQPSDTSLAETQPLPEEATEADEKVSAKRGRPGMPSWDDILFGTRSDEDPF